ncbi:hypothetical protein ABIB50_000016 [Mucilaginibacter sp. UYCu711]
MAGVRQWCFVKVTGLGSLNLEDKIYELQERWV